MKIRIVERDGVSAVPPGSIGEITVKGTSMMRGGTLLEGAGGTRGSGGTSDDGGTAR